MEPEPMRKVLVVALREYNAAVRTKAFVIGLAMMPLLMSGSLIVQWLLEEHRDTRPKRIAVVDRTPGSALLAELEQGVAAYNAAQADAETGKRRRAAIILDVVPAPPDEPDAVAEMRRELAGRLRKGKVSGWLVIGPDATRLAQPADPDRAAIEYHSNRPMDQDFVGVARMALGAGVRGLRAREAGLSPQKVAVVSRPIDLRARFEASFWVPFILMILMYMLVMLSATPLMQGVVEEKMQRIAEVLLGSVPPFPLMLGKLVGMTGVSLTMAAVYLGGGYWAAQRYEGMAEALSWEILAWFLVFQTLAALLFGSMFIAVGAACTDMRETQNLLWPVMLLATMPMFVIVQVLREPHSPVVTALSFVPFATPSLMIARQAMPPGPPLWQPLLGAAGMLLTTLACVWAAGRIFRVGILMMGKGATLAQIARWVLKG
jgi:ABC-2 type transport system permease protein